MGARGHKIVFHHIPKCGGMSLAAGIGLAYFPLQLAQHGRRGFPSHLNSKAASEACEASGLHKYTFRRQLLEYYLGANKSDYIFGHFPFSKKSYERHKEEWRFITCLRNPLERWYSEYYWNRYKDHEYAKTDLDMEAYLDSPEGQHYARSYINFLSSSETIDKAPTQKELNEALDALECFEVIGFLEDLKKFQDDMKHAFGRKPILLKRNKSPASKEQYEQKFEPGSNGYKKLTKMLEADNEIYQKAKERMGL